MFHQQLLVIVVLIWIDLIQSGITQFNCTLDEERQPCEGIEVVTCKTKQVLNFGNCKNSKCICADEGSVLNDEGACIPLWKCPTLCPRNSVFNFCERNHGKTSDELRLTVKEYSDICEPRCICLNGHLWNSRSQECYPAENRIIGQYALVREMRWNKWNKKFISTCGQDETMVCNTNSVFLPCRIPAACDPRLCGGYCACKDNYIRNYNGFCVHKKFNTDA